MRRLEYDLPVHRKPEAFCQTIRIYEGDELLGLARWHAPADSAEGVAQILDLTIEPPYRRRGHAHRLMEAIVAQAQKHYRLRQTSLRRLWICLEQKQQVIGRAFLMGVGFHHVGTVDNLFCKEDALICVRTFD